MDEKIWATGNSKVGGYLNLARNYKNKHGSLLGFLNKYGALIKDNGELYKVRVEGQRFKLANLTKYNAYQALRQSRLGYNKVREELLDLGIPKKEVDAFIEDDNQKYKQIASEVKTADKISAKPVQKGHIGSLESGFPDVSGNIEPELGSINAAKQGQSPLSEALLAEGRPRTSQEAFIRWKDSSGLPNPSDYTYEQKQLLRQAKNVDEIDDLLMGFDKGGAKLKPAQAVRAARGVSPMWASLPLGATALGMSGQSALANPSAETFEDVGWDAANLVADAASLIPVPMVVAGAEGAQKLLGIGHQARIGQRELAKQEGLPEPLKKFAEDPLNEFKYFGKQALNFFGSAVRMASPLGL